jgi:hypothetical protein
MFGNKERITKDGFRELMHDAPDVAIMLFYSLSKIHEKYRVTEWCIELLLEHGYDKETMKKFDADFVDVYTAMINQDDL